MKFYLVWSHDNHQSPDPLALHGVFSTKEKAEKYITDNPEDFEGLNSWIQPTLIDPK